MEIEKIERDTGIHNPFSAKEFVYNHRNIFADSSRRYIESSYPPIIKEIARFKEKVSYWFWIFKPDKYMIVKFNHKPSKKEYMEMLNMANKFFKEG